jgi:hypothetical protein
LVLELQLRSAPAPQSNSQLFILMSNSALGALY